ncbi:MAG: hypothetical protein WAO98_07605 [Alphaproteobacteria bacterium]
MGDDDFESPYPSVPRRLSPAEWFVMMKWYSTGKMPSRQVDAENLLADFRANPLAEFVKSTQELCGRIENPEAQRLFERFSDPNSQQYLDIYMMRAAILICDHFIDAISVSRLTIDRGLATFGRKLFMERSLR